MNNQPERKEFSDRIEYQLNCKLHREDGPAMEWADGNKEWYVDGNLHRTDGPAVEWADGDKAWWVNDKLHRLDGPAVECTDGTKEWWVGGKRRDKLGIDNIRLKTMTLSFVVNRRIWKLFGTNYVKKVI